MVWCGVMECYCVARYGGVSFIVVCFGVVIVLCVMRLCYSKVGKYYEFTAYH